MLYASLLKKHGSVVEAPKASGKTRSKADGPEPFGSIPQTVTRKVAADLGITDDTVRNRVKSAVKQAARAGVAVSKATPEAMSGDEMMQVGQTALKVAELTA